MGYYAICAPDQSSGVFRKVSGFTDAARKLGYNANYYLIPGGPSCHFRLALTVGLAKEDLIVIRNNSFASAVSAIGVIVARARGKQVVVDVATPMASVLREVVRSRSPAVVKCIKLIGFALSGPWSFWPATRLLQYAPESKWFTYGNSTRTLLIGNGVDVQKYSERVTCPPWPHHTLTLVAVAQLADWHGYDLLLRAIAQFRALGDTFKIELLVVGDGDALPQLRALAEELQLGSSVAFLGELSGEALLAVYSKAHLGVGSLALHRKGLTFASELKTREYCAVGLPFITACTDPDFPAETQFRFVVNTDKDCISDLVDLFSKLPHLQLPFPSEVRRYAMDRLDYAKKVARALAI